MIAFFRHYTPDQGFYPSLVAQTALRTIELNPYKFPQEETLSRYVTCNPYYFCGHHVMESEEFPQLTGADPIVPVSPLFARDLAGRTVYLGTGPEQKEAMDWQTVKFSNLPGFDPLERELLTSSIMFPAGCRSTIGMDGVDELETVFLTRFRNLEIAQEDGAPASGGSDIEIGVYDRANLYPYKLRVDTFYIDGYKLPQTAMLFARGEDEGIFPGAALKLGEEMLTRWKGRPQHFDWNKFYDAEGGEEWAEALFAKGCTLIPTFEAHNGYNVVSADFELTDYWPGRAVLGLHHVEGMKPSKAPFGTILEVIEPGFITCRAVYPARVIVSDGTQYVSPNGDNPTPLFPNLFLPHQRTISQWGSCWLPTHPGHFEAPALWGWDVLDTGRFVQMSGPLWDPLHYYYASVDVIKTAYDKPDTANTPVPVPDNMHNRFYPIVAPIGFDTFDHTELQRRQQQNTYPATAIVRYNNGKPGCDFGYHPLPLEYEYELEPFWMPDLHPLNRGHGLCPDDVMPRLAPVILAPIGSDVYRESVKAPEDAPWFTQEELMGIPSVDPVECYPQLARYILPDLPATDWMPQFPAPYLAQPRRELLLKPASEIWEDMDDPDIIDDIAPGLSEILPEVKEEGLTLMRYRHVLYQGKKNLYKLGWWYGLDADELSALDEEATNDQTRERAENTRQNNSRAAQVSRAHAQAGEAPAQSERRRAAAPAQGLPIIRGQ